MIEIDKLELIVAFDADIVCKSCERIVFNGYSPWRLGFHRDIASITTIPINFATLFHELAGKDWAVCLVIVPEELFEAVGEDLVTQVVVIVDVGDGICWCISIVFHSISTLRWELNFVVVVGDRLSCMLIVTVGARNTKVLNISIWLH